MFLPQNWEKYYVKKCCSTLYLRAKPLTRYDLQYNEKVVLKKYNILI